MTARRKIKPGAVTNRPGGHVLDDIEFLVLDEVRVAQVGLFRATLNAVKFHPAVMESFARARTMGPAGITLHMNAAGRLSRRTAQHYAIMQPAPETDSDVAPF